MGCRRRGSQSARFERYSHPMTSEAIAQPLLPIRLQKQSLIKAALFMVLASVGLLPHFMLCAVFGPGGFYRHFCRDHCRHGDQFRILFCAAGDLPFSAKSFSCCRDADYADARAVYADAGDEFRQYYNCMPFLRSYMDAGAAAFAGR